MKMHAKCFISVLLTLTIVFAVCPFAYAQQETLACGHNSYDVTISAKEPTCEEYGYTEQRECKVCTYVQKAQYIPETGHTYEMNKNALSKSGALYTCKNCDDYYVKPHLNWSYTILEKKPTCTEGGHSAERKCLDCGYYEESVYLPAVNHKLITVLTDETKHTVKCESCSYEKTNENHDIVFIYDKDYNCYSENATGKKQCRICNTVLESNIELTDKQHHQNVVVEDKGAYEVHTCKDCGYVEVVAKDVNCVCGNTVAAESFVVKQPSCEKSGYISYTCSSCGRQKTEAIAEFGHCLSEKLALIQQATCQQPGIKAKDCYRCDYVEKVELGKVGHMYVVVSEGIPVTCTEPGVSDAGYCVYCFDYRDHAVIPATGHTLIDYNGEQFCTTCYKYLVETDKGTVACKCLCHNHDGLSVTIFKLIMFFAKIFGFMQSCDCGAVHYEK